MSKRELSVGQLIQYNQEESAIHYLALIIEKSHSVNKKNHKLSVVYDDIIEALLLGYKVIGLDENRIESEAYKLDQSYRKESRRGLVLVK